MQQQRLKEHILNAEIVGDLRANGAVGQRAQPDGCQPLGIEIWPTQVGVSLVDAGR